MAIVQSFCSTLKRTKGIKISPNILVNLSAFHRSIFLQLKQLWVLNAFEESDKKEDDDYEGEGGGEIIHDFLNLQKLTENGKFCAYGI